MTYASRINRDPGETYRSIDVASRTGGADRHELITILYEDVVRELRLGAIAIEAGDHSAKSARLTKAVALLFALESGLDFDKGGDIADTLSRFYRGCRDAAMRASIENNADLVRDVVTNVGEIAASWKAIGGR